MYRVDSVSVAYATFVRVLAIASYLTRVCNVVSQQLLFFQGECVLPKPAALQRLWYQQALLLTCCESIKTSVVIVIVAVVKRQG